MKIGRVLLVGAMLATCTTSAALAGTKVMASAPAAQYYPSFGGVMHCDIVNLNTSPKNVTVEVRDYLGNIVDGPIGPLTLVPGQAFALQAFSGQGAWCRFEVDGNTKKYRAVAIYNNGSEYSVAIPAY